MSKIFYKLEDIEDFDHTGSHYFDASFAPTMVENASDIDLWDTDNFKDIFDQVSERSILLKETSDPWGAFLNKYDQWIARNGNLIANEAYTLYSKYNPIHNYDRHEEYTGADTVTKTPTEWKETRTETPNNWKETTTETPANWIKTDERSYTNYHETETDRPTNWEKTETQTPTAWKKETKSTDALNPSEDFNKVVPFNGETLETVSGTLHFINDTEEQKGTFQTTESQAGTYERDTTKTGKETLTEQQSGTFTTERAESGTRTTTSEQTGTFEDETSYGKIVDISGNIGTMTTGAMIKEIVELYDNDFISRWLYRFFDAYCVYV